MIDLCQCTSVLIVVIFVFNHFTGQHLFLQGFDDGYGGEYDEESYEAYEDNYSNQSKR